MRPGRPAPAGRHQGGPGRNTHQRHDHGALHLQQRLGAEHPGNQNHRRHHPEAAECSQPVPLPGSTLSRRAVLRITEPGEVKVDCRELYDLDGLVPRADTGTELTSHTAPTAR